MLNKTKVCLRGLFSLVTSWIICGCAVQKHASGFPDYIPSDHPNYFVNYHVNEWYELRKPMFLVILTSGEPCIVVPGHSSPTLELYFTDIDKRNERIKKYRVKRFLPKGTRIRIMSIKFVNGEDPMPYFSLDDNNQWLAALFIQCILVDGPISGPKAKARLEGKKIGPKVRFVWDYDREYFRKM